MTSANRFWPILNHMLMDLISCWQSKGTELQRVEKAITITRKYCDEVQHECWKNGFCNQGEEIDYFKYMQPQFTGRLAYLNKLEASLLKLQNENETGTIFWLRESRKFNDFHRRNKCFIDYMESGESNEDEQYFLHSDVKHVKSSIAPLTTIKECIPKLKFPATALYAEKHYHEYVRHQLSN
jgi:hypothetical protein